MKNIIPIIFLLLSSFAHAQSDSLRLQIGGVAGLGYGHRVLTTTESELDLIEESYNNLEDPTMSYRFGLRVNYNISSKSFLSTGLLFAQNGYRVDSIAIAALHDIRFRYQYLEVPILFHYRFISNKKINPYITLGVNGCYILSSTMHFKRINELEKYKEKVSEGVNKVQYGLLGGLGFSKRFHERYELFVEGNYNRNISSLHDGVLERRFTNVSLNFGLTYFL